MAKKRAVVGIEDAQRALGTDILDRILEAEGLTEIPVIEVAVDQIAPNPYQTRQEFDEEGLQELATSIRAHGFYGHLVARQVDDRYQLAYGERRLRAAQLAELPRLPLAIRDLNDEQMMELAITENVLRKDLNPIEEAEAYRHLVNLGYSLRRVSEKVGKSPGHVSVLLSLLKKEDVAESVRQERIGIREAHEIAKVEDDVRRQDLLDRTARRELDREAVRQAVRLIGEQAAAPLPTVPPVPIGEPGVESEASADETTADETITQPTVLPPLLPGYDPLPNLRAALKRLEKIRPDRFNDIAEHDRDDVHALLDDIASRARYFMEQLGRKAS